MKNEKTKLQEIKELVKRGMSLALATALVVGAVTLSSCNNENIPDNGGDEVIDMENPPADIVLEVSPDKPLTKEQQEVADTVVSTLSKYNYTFSDSLIKSISSIYTPGNMSDLCGISINLLNPQTNERSSISLRANIATLAQLSLLAHECKDAKLNGIKDIKVEEYEATFNNNMQSINIEFDTNNYNEELINKFLYNLLEYLPKTIEIEGVEKISPTQKQQLNDFLISKDPLFSNGIYNITLHEIIFSNNEKGCSVIIRANNEGSFNTGSAEEIVFSPDPTAFDKFKNSLNIEKIGQTESSTGINNSTINTYSIPMNQIKSDTLIDQLLLLIHQFITEQQQNDELMPTN